MAAAAALHCVEMLHRALGGTLLDAFYAILLFVMIGFNAVWDRASVYAALGAILVVVAATVVMWGHKISSTAHKLIESSNNR
jgi:hypothetical protein